MTYAEVEQICLFTCISDINILYESEFVFEEENRNPIQGEESKNQTQRGESRNPIPRGEQQNSNIELKGRGLKLKDSSEAKSWVFPPNPLESGLAYARNDKLSSSTTRQMQPEFNPSDEKRFCPYCSNSYDFDFEQYQLHINICSSRTASGVVQLDLKPGDSKQTTRYITDSLNERQCPVCEKSFASQTTLNDIQRHINEHFDS